MTAATLASTVSRTLSIASQHPPEQALHNDIGLYLARAFKYVQNTCVAQYSADGIHTMVAVMRAMQADEPSARRTLLSPPFTFILRRRGWRHVAPKLVNTQSLPRGGARRAAFYYKPGSNKGCRECKHENDTAGQTYHLPLTPQGLRHRNTYARIPTILARFCGEIGHATLHEIKGRLA
jgi:hypothetical protein